MIVPSEPPARGRAGLLGVGEVVAARGADDERRAVGGGEGAVGGGELVAGCGLVDREAGEGGEAVDGGEGGGAGEGGGGVAGAGLERERDVRGVGCLVAVLVEDRDLDRAERGAGRGRAGLLGEREVIWGGRADREGVAVGGGEGAVGCVQLVAGCGLVDREAAEGREAVDGGDGGGAGEGGGGVAGAGLEREGDVRGVGGLVAVGVEDRDLDRAERGARVRRSRLLRVDEVVGRGRADRDGGAVRRREAAARRMQLVAAGRLVDRQPAEGRNAVHGGNGLRPGKCRGRISGAALDRDRDARGVARGGCRTGRGSRR